MSQKKEDPLLIKAILEIKERQPYFGVPRVLWMLRKRGYIVNGKRVYRILRTLRLNVSKVKRNKRMWNQSTAVGVPQAKQIGDVWAMDFVFDRLMNGTSFRCLTIIDTLSRQVPNIFVSHSMAGFTPVDMLEELKSTIKLPKYFILDNGSEFANYVFLDWCKQSEIKVHFIERGSRYKTPI